MSRKRRVQVNINLVMEKCTHIASLVEKLLNGNLSSEELRELQQLFRSPEAKGEVEEWLGSLWRLSKDEDESFIDLRHILDQLNDKVRESEQSHHVSKHEDDRVSRFVRSVMRYAAVFIVAVAVSWYWFRNERPETKVPVVVGEVVASNGANEVSVTYGSKTRIVLPDSSVVYLNSGSKLSYPPVFDRERNVALTGEGYFIVRSDSLHPFVVHTSDVSIKALGTEFNVKAYPEEQRVETILVKGTVEILKKNQTKPIIGLKPGEKATYMKAAVPKQAVSIPVKEQPQMMVNVDLKPDVSTGWVNNQLVFDAEPFDQIAARLERWFNVEIVIRNSVLSRAHLSGRYDTENIEQVMHSLQMTTPFTYKIEKNKIIIK